MPPPTVIDLDLWESIKQKAKRTFERWPSAYASAWIAKEYKKRGGRYRENRVNRHEAMGITKSVFSSPPKRIRSGSNTKHTENGTGTDRWMREEWIQVVPYVTQSRKRVPCGSSYKKRKACRPYRRISKKTPISIDEVLSKHGTKTTLLLAREKEKDMNTRVNWVKGTHTGAPKGGRRSPLNPQLTPSTRQLRQRRRRRRPSSSRSP